MDWLSFTVPDWSRLSVSSNGSTWVKRQAKRRRRQRSRRLSVSSNGSTWVKLNALRAALPARKSFSILERIDVGETCTAGLKKTGWSPSFSILERIDVGETPRRWRSSRHPGGLSVSSNGSTWVKHPLYAQAGRWYSHFQYPRTDRRG